MTTKVIVEANHGWPVEVKGVHPKTGEKIATYGGTIEAGQRQEFFCHSDMDLRIHEVQPGEVDQDNPAAA